MSFIGENGGSFSESIDFLKKESFSVIKWDSILKMGVIRWEQNVKNKKEVIKWQEV